MVVLAVLEVEDKKEEVAYKGLEVVSVLLVVVDSVADGEGLKLEPEIEGVIVMMVVVMVVIVVMAVTVVTVVTMVVHEREVVLASWGRSPDVDRVGFLVGELDGDSGVSEVITRPTVLEDRPFEKLGATNGLVLELLVKEVGGAGCIVQAELDTLVEAFLEVS